MGGLFLTRGGDAALAGARTRFASQDFGDARPFAIDGWHGLAFDTGHGGPQTMLRDGDDLIAVAGTPTCDGKLGRAALAAMLAMPDALAPDWSRLGGQFIAVLRKNGRTVVFGDYLGHFQLFHDDDRTFFSTTLLAAADRLPVRRFDRQGVYEFAFDVVPLGNDTVFAGLKLLDPRTIVELTADGTVLHRVAKPLSATAAIDAPDAIVARHRDALMAAVTPHVTAFGDNVVCPLSGGMDSRLVFAALRAAGCTPRVYVYGPPGSADVGIARAIGRSQGFAVDWIDKSAAPLVPDAFADIVRANFDRFDGLPNYGNIFDNGGHLVAMDVRHAGGALLVSGGAGEIYRNFFYLPDRRFTARAVADTFFARFDRRDATPRFRPDAFLDAIAAKAAAALDRPHDGGALSRLEIEQLYPRLRTRALFGRELSIEARQGAYLMPFLDQHVVAEAMTLPLAMKAAGRFEAALIAAIDPALAREPSAYGHDFAGPPGAAHRFAEWRSTLKPVWLRRHSYAVQRRLRTMGDEHGGLLSADYMGRVIDLDFPAMRRFFNVDRITDSGLWRRIACLEYLAERMDVRDGDAS